MEQAYYQVNNHPGFNFCKDPCQSCYTFTVSYFVNAYYKITLWIKWSGLW